MALASLVRDEGAKVYRDTLIALGTSLATAVVSTTGPLRKTFAIVSTPEDADFLTRGILQILPRRHARLACYWTDRRTFGDGDVATVVQQFEDPRLVRRVDTVIVASAIIASGCTTRTILEQFLENNAPHRIVIAAPVMLRGAERRLRAAFSTDISSRLEFVTFAIDSKKEGAEVVPGIGGMGEERLGLSGKSPRFMSALVQEWRATV